jgi:hypothetical protein
MLPRIFFHTYCPGSKQARLVSVCVAGGIVEVFHNWRIFSHNRGVKFLVLLSGKPFLYSLFFMPSEGETLSKFSKVILQIFNTNLNISLK